MAFDLSPPFQRVGMRVLVECWALAREFLCFILLKGHREVGMRKCGQRCPALPRVTQPLLRDRARIGRQAL